MVVEMIASIDRILMSNQVIRCIVLLLTLLILGFIDYSTGYEYSFSVFYLIPVSLAAWYASRFLTIVIIIASAMTWIFADFIAGHNYSSDWIPLWNACVRIGFFSIVAFLLFKVRSHLKEMTNMAMKDSLTSLNNTRAFDLKYQLLRTMRYKKKTQCAVGIVDLDGFKAVNDNFGHSKGDEVLIQFAQILADVTRGSDIIARMGGDEFAVILLETDQSGVQEYDKRLRKVFQNSPLKNDFGIDYSMGITLFDTHNLPEKLDDATRYADRLMYESKAHGKSQTTIRTI